MNAWGRSVPPEMCHIWRKPDNLEKWESVNDFTSRLGLAGCLKEFKAEVEALKQEGVAHPERWVAVAKRYGPAGQWYDGEGVLRFGEVSEGKGLVAEGDVDGFDVHDVEPIDMVGTDKSINATLMRDAPWVWRNAGRKKLSRDDPPPSSGAKMLWEMTLKADQKAKVLDFIVKFIPPPKMQEQATRLEDDGSSTLDLIRKIREAVA